MIHTTKRWFLASGVALIFLRADICQAQEVDSILDRLEQRLRQQERGVLFFSPDKEKSFEDPLNSATILNLPKATVVTGRLREEDKIKQIASAISTIKGEVDILASEVHQTRQNIIDQSQINNYVELKAKLKGPESLHIKSIMVKIDNYPLLSLPESISLRADHQSYPIYSGPLNPGTHRIDLVANVGLKEKMETPLQNESMQSINKSFQIQIPHGPFQRSWTLEMEASQQRGQFVQINVVEKDIL
jgi:hypothetical protein